jgi:hypothetical protein
LTLAWDSEGQGMIRAALLVTIVGYECRMTNIACAPGWRIEQIHESARACEIFGWYPATA